MRRAAIATTSTVAGVVLLLSLKPHHSAAPVLAASAVSSPTRSAASPTPSGAASHSASSTSGASSASASPTSPTSPTGTFTGAVEQTPYGPVQVAVTLSHGKLTNVRALQTPSDEERSQEIASYAVPRLTQEALGAQGASIDAVSGASYTSAGYVQSLQSALDKAGA